MHTSATASQQLKPLAATSSEETDQDASCTSDVRVCLRRTLVDGGAIIAAYAVILYATDGVMPSPHKVIKFYLLFAALAFLFRLLDADLDQLTRVAGFQLGLKLFGVLA